jgi:hypothetical protein
MSRPTRRRPPVLRGGVHARYWRTGSDSPTSRQNVEEDSWRGQRRVMAFHSLDKPSTFPMVGPASPSDGQRRRRTTRPTAVPIAIPPTTSEAWWARRWIRLRPIRPAPAYSRALPVWSPGRLRTEAEQNAARVCPLGKLLVFGARTGTPVFEIRSSEVSGRFRPTSRLMPALTSVDETPATPRERTAWRRAEPDRRPRHTAIPVHNQPWSPRPVITLAAESTAALPRMGSNRRSTASSNDVTAADNPDSGARSVP